MGTKWSYIQLKNRGFDLAELQSCLNILANDLKNASYAPTDPFRKFLESQLSSDGLEILFQLRAAERESWNEPPHIAFRANSEWLPLFQIYLCGGGYPSVQDLKRLSKTFDTPVMFFSIFDSDSLFLSYCDGATGMCQEYFKPNWNEDDNYDMRRYQKAFPEFLVWLCPPEHRAELRKVWDGDEVFADDRMLKLFRLLGMEIFDPETEQFPQGFEIVRPE